MENNTELQNLAASFPDESGAFIEYVSALPGYPDTDRRASMERRNQPTELNYRPEGNANIPFEESDMRGLQVRQPFTGANGENMLIFHLPSLGYEALIFKFAAMDEGAATAIQLDYSVQSGEPEWITDGLSPAQINQSLATDEYRLYELNLANIPEANDNPDLKIRLRFVTPDGDADDGNRVTFNNFSLDGTETEA